MNWGSDAGWVISNVNIDSVNLCYVSFIIRVAKISTLNYDEKKVGYL